MTRRSKRELERALEDLDDDGGGNGDDPPLMIIEHADGDRTVIP